jgi:hypothetical protein
MNDTRDDLFPAPNDGAGDAKLLAALGDLPLEIEPERDLLPGVRGRIAARRFVRRSRLAGLAAALALVAGGAFLATREARLPAPEIAATEAPPAVVPASAVRRTAYSEPDRALEEIRLLLRQEIEAKQDRLPPATRALVFENLATIDRAIAEIEQALDAEPGNPELGRTYIAYREREIDLLRQANRVAARL